MNKLSRKTAKTVGIIALVLLGVVFFRGCLETYIFIEKDPNLKYEIYDQDKYIHFSDGRFQVWRWPTDMEKLQLMDFKYDDYLVRYLYWYRLHEDKLYIEGNVERGTGTDAEGNISYWGGVDTSNGKILMYDDQNDLPRFVVLDITSGEAEYYLSLEEIPETDRAVFEMDLTGEDCLKARTCYEVGADTELNWLDILGKIIKNSFSW
jgi:hypothetical protein